jgi:hypothetical protein
MKHFPNGFTSWMETHHEIVALITTELLKQEPTGVVMVRSEAQGYGGVYEYAEELTDEFEKLNAGRDWDGEFYDEVELFFEQKNYAE